MGHGTNVEYQTPPSGEQVIVSRSHAGSVEKVVKDAFGEQAQVTPAGGAGKMKLNLLLLQRSFISPDVNKTFLTLKCFSLCFSLF